MRKSEKEEGLTRWTGACRAEQIIHSESRPAAKQLLHTIPIVRYCRSCLVPRSTSLVIIPDHCRPHSCYVLHTLIASLRIGCLLTAWKVSQANYGLGARGSTKVAPVFPVHIPRDVSRCWLQCSLVGYQANFAPDS